MGDNQNVFELAMQLGRALKADERLVRMEKVRAEFETNEEITALMSEYDVQQKALATAYSSTERDEAFINSINGRITAIYEQVITTEAYKNYEAAQNEVNDLMEQVNNAIQAAVSGVEPSGCTHNCATCKGCH